MVTINELVDVASEIARKTVTKVYVGGPTGVRGRNSDNRLIEEKLGWKPKYTLREGLEHTYDWIESQIQKKVAKQMKDAITL
jgi:nucleoside-diphosphate-sugar epimerase